MMELEMASLTDAAWGVKDPAPLVQRNGYCERYMALETDPKLGDHATVSIRGMIAPATPETPADCGKLCHVMGDDPGGGITHMRSIRIPDAFFRRFSAA